MSSVIPKKTVPFSLYDAFSSSAFGGSQGAVVLNASNFDAKIRQTIASELGWPATCFVNSVIGSKVVARFHSTEREYPMCGHGTICLMTRLRENGMLQPARSGMLEVDLVLPTKTASVEIRCQSNGSALVMLDIAPPKFQNDKPDIKMLARLLGLNETDIDPAYPVETALGDFVHLIIPLKSLTAIQCIKPDFAAIKAFCRGNGFETIACFSTDTEQAGYDFHLRDFCPAVGVAESAAAGTTNAALAAWLYRHGLVEDDGTGKCEVKVEQGLEIGRASTIYITLHLDNHAITRLQVGGVATKVLEGHLLLPDIE